MSTIDNIIQYESKDNNFNKQKIPKKNSIQRPSLKWVEGLKIRRQSISEYNIH